VWAGGVFWKNLSSAMEARPFDGVFGLYLTVIYEPDKKIESRKFSIPLEKWELFRHPIFLPSPWIPAE
jgi:hypothetical protein